MTGQNFIYKLQKQRKLISYKAQSSNYVDFWSLLIFFSNLVFLTIFGN